MSDNAFKVNRALTLNPQSSVPTNPVNGDLYYDASLNTFVFYDNGFWINLASQVDVPSATSLNSTEFTATIVQNSLVRVTGSTASSLYGLTASTAGKQVIVYNDSTAAIVVYNQNAGEPTAANQITTPSGANLTISTGGTATFIYDASQALWIASTGSGSGGGSGEAGEVALSSGITTIAVTYGVPLTTTTYSVIAQMVNSTDANPEYIPVIISDKTTTGFMASWNTPLPTNNYFLDYAVSGAQDQFGEALISSGVTSAVITLPVPISGSYVVIAEFANSVDANPQYQPVTIQAKGMSSFIVGWNAPTASSNYRLEYQVTLT